MFNINWSNSFNSWICPSFIRHVDEQAQMKHFIVYILSFDIDPIKVDTVVRIPNNFELHSMVSTSPLCLIPHHSASRTSGLAWQILHLIWKDRGDTDWNTKERFGECKTFLEKIAKNDVSFFLLALQHNPQRYQSKTLLWSKKMSI